jgi:hypothetical protein
VAAAAPAVEELTAAIGVCLLCDSGGKGQEEHDSEHKSGERDCDQTCWSDSEQVFPN